MPNAVCLMSGKIGSPSRWLSTEHRVRNRNPQLKPPATYSHSVFVPRSFYASKGGIELLIMISFLPGPTLSRSRSISKEKAVLPARCLKPILFVFNVSGIFERILAVILEKPRTDTSPQIPVRPYPILGRHWAD